MSSSFTGTYMRTIWSDDKKSGANRCHLRSLTYKSHAYLQKHEFFVKITEAVRKTRITKITDLDTYIILSVIKSSIRIYIVVIYWTLFADGLTFYVKFSFFCSNKILLYLWPVFRFCPLRMKPKIGSIYSRISVPIPYNIHLSPSQVIRAVSIAINLESTTMSTFNV